MSIDKTGWKSLPIENGIVSYELNGWRDFQDLLAEDAFAKTGRGLDRLIWRGQRESVWPLSSSIDRLFERLHYTGTAITSAELRAAEHLDDFKYAARGRRRFTGPMNENEWWALGQHFGLATPLLDWTHSPYVAVYFAFEDDHSDSTHRVVFGLDRDAVRLKNETIIEESGDKDSRPPILELIDPLSDENPRLVTQGALFTRGPADISVDTWVNAFFVGSPTPVLYRIEIPSVDRAACLRALNKMNINHLSLFPDLMGASRATNLRTELDLS